MILVTRVQLLIAGSIFVDFVIFASILVRKD